VRSLIAGVLVLVVGATGCSARNVDINATGAQPVQGAQNLYRFCDGPVTIYFTKQAGADDEYDWYWPGGCVKNGNGQWVFASTVSAVPPPGDSTDNN
jgi:hypothetical protein